MPALPSRVVATSRGDRTRFELAARADAISLFAALLQFRPFVVSLGRNGYAVHCSTAGAQDRGTLESAVEAWLAGASRVAA
jgi:hypothetical protein